MQIPTGVKQSGPVALATVPLGVTFGVLASPLIGEWQAVLMSALVWSGSAQFAVLSALSGGSPPFLAALTGVIANTRYLAMGFAIAPSATGSLAHRAFGAALLTDASLIIGRGSEGRYDMARIAWAAPLQYLAWTGGTAIGALAGDIIGDAQDLGLDALLPVFFLGLLIPELQTSKPLVIRAIADLWTWRSLVVALGAATIALALTPFTPTGIPVLAGATAALLGLWPGTTEDGKGKRT